MRFWKRHREPELDGELRANRPQAREDFVLELTGRLQERPVRPQRRSAARVALAGAVIAGLLASAGVMGGFSYAATAAKSVVGSVKHVLAANGGGPVESNLSSGGDQYQPGYEWGDPAHGHDGAPGLSRKGGDLAPPLVVDCKNGVARVVARIVVDEQVDLRISARGKGNRKLPLAQADGSTGTSLDYRVLIPRVIRFTLDIPCNLVVSGRTHRITIIATDPSGQLSKLIVPFRVQTATQ